MRLVSCYVAGFGQIKDFSYDFNQGLNTIIQENGWGKTTFSAFLKAMFFGMENYTNSQKKLVDRKHYMPWSGGKYGGSITFEAGGGTYRLERFFGKKDKEDTFALFDAKTGMPSSDFTVNIGEEIFEVDKDSFEKSIFVGQGSIATAMTDRLNAKMGNLSASKDDINNYDLALGRVVEAQKEFSRTSKVNTGKLILLKEEINRCSETIDKKPAVLDGYHKLLEKIDKAKRHKNWLEAEKDRTATQILEQSKRDQERGAFQQKMADLENLRDELSKESKFYKSDVPSEVEQHQMEDIERELDLNLRIKHDLEEKIPPQPIINRWEALFAGGKVEKYTIDEWRKKALRIQELVLAEKHAQLSEEGQQQLKELQIFFSRKLPSDEEVAQMEDLTEELTALEAKISNQEEIYNSQKNKIDFEERQGRSSQNILYLIIPLFIGGVLLAAGTAFYMMGLKDVVRKISTAAFAFVGALCLVVGVGSYIRRRASFKKHMEDMQNDLLGQEKSLEEMRLTRSDIRQMVNAFLGNFMLNPTHSMRMMVFDIRQNREMFLHLQEQDQHAQSQTAEAIEELAQLRMELYLLLESYARVYNMDLYAEGCELDLLDDLERDAPLYEEYLSANAQLLDLKKSTEEQSKLLENYLARFEVEEGVSHSELLKQIATRTEQYLRLRETVNLRQEEIDSFNGEAMNEANSISIEQVQQQQLVIEEELLHVQEAILQDREALSDTLAMLDEIEEAERRHEELSERRLQYQRQLDLLERTEKMLCKAKELFMARYMAPLQTAMKQYLDLMDKTKTGQVPLDLVELNIDLTVRLVTGGESHGAAYLSCGYQDLISLCARFALTDVLYKGEQPMMVLDDPFTNLDAARTACGMELLQQIAKNRQILYFTCHESRMP